MHKEKDLVFITSGGRTGTTFFGEKLSGMIDDCFSVHEPDLKYGWRDRRTWQNIYTFGVWHMLIGRALGRTGALPTALRYHTGALSHDDAVSRIHVSRAGYHMKKKETLIVEANPQWGPILPLLRGAFPKAKIVAITRDQDTWVRSWLKRGTRHTPRDPVSPAKRLTAVTLRDPKYAVKWPTMTADERLRWEWRFVNEQMKNFAREDSLTKLYSYEELFLSDGAAMQDLLGFVTTHDGRRYEHHFDPSMLSERINAA